MTSITLPERCDRETGDGAVILPSDALSEAAALTGLADELFSGVLA